MIRTFGKMGKDVVEENNSGISDTYFSFSISFRTFSFGTQQLNW
ncbi:hypothetical protein [Lederbergia citrea]|nr:hypothetical protein [Lederbergia citrea]